jgi:secreted trypsin-like serine protease
MRTYWLNAVLLGCTVVAAAPTSSQEVSEKAILPAPTSTDRAASRSSKESSEPHKYTNRVVGGVASAGRPFMAALLYEKGGNMYQYCGASVVGTRWLLTAAHCQVKEGEWAIINRSHLQAVGGAKLRVEHVYIHQQYDPDSHDNDISLLKLSGDISGGISPLSFAAPPATGVRVTTAGWGLTTENGKQSLELREVTVPVVASKQCKSSYGNLTDNMICAGEAGKDSCQGDSGGPLFIDSASGAQQIGIVSYGVGCGRSGYPGVYTEVDRYRNWINTTITH